MGVRAAALKTPAELGFGHNACTPFRFEHLKWSRMLERESRKNLRRLLGRR